MNICVIGLGKIGLPLAVHFAKMGNSVIGSDINKSTVDLAARLSSLGVIDIRVCQVSSKAVGLDRADLLPFVSPVDFGQAELKSLLEEEDYSFF